MRIDPDSARLVPYAFARDAKLVYAGEDAGAAQVWICAQTDPGALAELARRFGRLATQWKSETEVEEGLRIAYAQADGAAARIVDEAEADIDISRLMQDIPAIEDLLEAEDDAPIIRMINALLTQAARDGASDIHIEAFESHSIVRFRVDGTLRDIARPKKALHAALISRIKIMAQLDIAEKRLPQDGRITLKVAGRPVDVRVSTLPTGHGERAVLRLLEKDAGRLDLAKLGMAADTLATFDRLVGQPHGIILVTGPTGSGKTTTLYAAMQRLDASTTNIMTVEDPIEYDLPGIGQTQVNARIDMTFAKALRAILRQDPDVIMIGEIRDLETAQIAVQASLTGHLVLATLHTNDSASAITRLTDMGVEPFLLSSSVLGVMAQRLVRKLCTHCRQPELVDSGADLRGVSSGREPSGAAKTRVWRAVGCDKCGNTGYVGRTGIYELLVVDDEMRHLIHNGANELDIRRSGARHGMRAMRDDGLRWVESGVTSPEEVVRVTRD